MEQKKIGAIVVALIIIIAIFIGLIKNKEDDEEEKIEEKVSFIDIYPGKHFCIYYEPEWEVFAKKWKRDRDKNWICS